MLWLGSTLGFNKQEDWYKVTTDDFLRHKGSSLLRFYHGSIPKLVSTIFSELNWNLHRFPGKYGGDTVVGRLSLDQLGTLIGANTYSDWYHVNKALILGHGYSAIFKHCNNSPFLFTNSFYPTFLWKQWCFRQSPKNFWKDLANQRQFLDHLGKVFIILKKYR